MPLDFAKLVQEAGRLGAYEPASAATILRAEQQLGFAIPELLKRVYLEAGDGGFGPGYGFYGLTDGTDEFPDETVVGLYLSFRNDDPEDPSWHWPVKLLPIVDWGCAIRSCLDCSTSSLEMIRFDPNYAGEEPELMFLPEKYLFADWLQAWLDGKNLW